MRTLLAIVLLLSLGCGDDPSSDDDLPPVDGGVGSDSGTEPACELGGATASQPATAEEVVWACPPGWRAVDGACSPWPAEGPEQSCAPGEAHFPGTPDCAPIGTDCPVEDFTEPPAEYATWDRVYVNPRATPGGDGSSPETALTSFRD